MHDLVWIIVALLILAIAGVITIKKGSGKFETFVSDTRDADVNKYVVKIYNDILDRNPTPDELTEQRQAILGGKRTFDDVRQRLIDSPEYSDMMKMQSNHITPELPKMISDSKLLRHLSDVYTEERHKTIPPAMTLPIKDIYIKLNYNEQALRYMLRSAQWADFEENIMNADNFSPQMLSDLMDSMYGGPDKIIADAAAADPNAEADVSGASVNDKVDRMIADEDSDMTCLLNDINENGYDLNAASSNCHCATSGTPICSVPVRVPTHERDGYMVLRPEFAWSVPQPRAPVCTSLGQPSLVQPVYMTSDKTLMGTPLHDAKQSGVGSIMPKFSYKEYVDMNMKKVCSSSNQTS